MTSESSARAVGLNADLHVASDNPFDGGDHLHRADIGHQDLIASECENMGNAVAHLARTDNAYSSDIHST